MAGHQDADFDALLEQSSLGGMAATRLRARTSPSWARIVRRITERSPRRTGSRGTQEEIARDRELHQQLIAEMMNLAKVADMDMLDNLPDRKRRQMLFAHQEYELLLHGHRRGILGWDELLGYLSSLASNQLFQEYWEMTTGHRRNIPQHSVEADVSKAVDELMEESADDCDEWWVVGPSSDS